jgi:predicted RNase H-like HicB family nuclease
LTGPGDDARLVELASMDTLAYRVILEPDEDGFRAIIPAFPRVFTCGDDVEDALRMAADAIGLELSVLRERGLPIPDPDGDAEVRVERVVVSAPAA